MGYVVLIAPCMLLFFLGDYANKERNKRIFYYSGVFWISLITASRVQLGADYNGYLNAYIRVMNGGTSSQFDLFFSILMQATAKLGLNFHWFLFVCGLINYCLLLKSINNFGFQSKGLYISIYLLYFALSIYPLSAIRQMFAISICTYSVRYVEEKKFIKYSISCVIAGLFHWSAFVLIPIYYLYIYLHNNSLTKRIICYSLIALLYFFLDAILLRFRNILSYNLYYYFFIERNVQSNNFSVGIILLIVLIGFSLFFTKFEGYEIFNGKFLLTSKEFGSEEITPIYFISTEIFFLLKILQAFRYQNVLPRFQMYFYCFLPATICYIIDNYVYQKKIVGLIVIVLMLLFFIREINIDNYRELMLSFEWILGTGTV